MDLPGSVRRLMLSLGFYPRFIGAPASDRGCDPSSAQLRMWSCLTPGQDRKRQPITSLAREWLDPRTASFETASRQDPGMLSDIYATTPTEVVLIRTTEPLRNAEELRPAVAPWHCLRVSRTVAALRMYVTTSLYAFVSQARLSVLTLLMYRG